MKNPSFKTLLVMTICFTGNAFLLAQDGSRGFKLEKVDIEDLNNAAATFHVSVGMDRKDLVYEEGDQFSIDVKSTKDCYIHLFNINPEKVVTMLFPNEHDKNNFVKAKQKLHLPTPDSGTQYTAGAPFGNDRMVVVATRQPLNLLTEADIERFAAGEVFWNTLNKAAPAKTKQLQGAKGFVVEVKKKMKPEDWVVRFLHVKTVAKAGRKKVVARKPRKLLVSIGVQKYKDRLHRQLNTPHLDADEFSKVLTTQGGFELVGKLTGKEATTAAIRKLIYTDLRLASQPGDTVVIFWSGHGGRTSDVDGDERDGFDEYLITYDSKYLDTKTAVLDDQFFDWTTSLKGRKLTLVMDTCYSAGTAKGAGSDDVEFDFFDGEFARSKSLDGNQAVLLAASQAGEKAWERTDRKMSVMTYFLVDAIKRNKTLSVKAAYEKIRQPMQEYMKKHLPGKPQRPILAGDSADDVFFRE